MANHSLPTLNSNYTNFIGEVGGRIDDAVRQNRSDTVTLTNPPVGTIRWNTGGARWESNTGTAGAPVWSTLAASYGISITGNAATVTNGVYSVGDQTIGGIKTFTSNIVASGGISGALSGNATGVSVAGTAAITATGANPVTISTNGAERVRVDAAGNFGIGVVPTLWANFGPGQNAIQSMSWSVSNDVNSHYQANNAYYAAGGWTYISGTKRATLYQQDSSAGSHKWYVAPSGAAGSIINFSLAMTLDSSGRLGIGSAAPSTRLQVGDAADASNVALVTSSGTSGYSQVQVDLNGYGSLLMLANRSGSTALGVTSGDVGLMATGGAPNLILGTNATERARMDPGGNLGAHSSVTGHWQIPRGTTAQRPTGASGMIRFNTTLGRYEGHNGTAWSSIGGGATGGGSDDIFMENGQTVTTNYTITAGKNAMSAGPITIANGITVTVPSGSTWVIA